MSIHVAPSTLHLRFFNDGNIDVNRPIYQMSSPYDHFCTLTIDDNGNGRIEGVTFTITRRHFSELKTKLPAFGIKQVTWRHKGKEQRIVLVKA